MNKVMLPVTMLCLFAACTADDTGVEYSEFQHIDTKQWVRERTLEFDPFPIDSVEKVCDVLLVVRNTTDYPYKQLWLAVRPEIEGAPQRADTIAVKLMDEQNEWTGTGHHNIFTTTITLMENVPVKEGYHLSVSHAMVPDTLMGINDIGIILKRKDKVSK